MDNGLFKETYTLEKSIEETNLKVFLLKFGIISV